MLLVRSLLLAGLTVAALVVYRGMELSHAPLQKEEDSRVVAGESLESKLAGLDSALDQGMNASQIQQLAFDIETEIQLHPLPEGDEARFCGELIVRYLKELATLENYRRLKLAREGYDPLDPLSQRADKEKIEARNKHLASLRNRTRDLREMLSKHAAQSPG